MTDKKLLSIIPTSKVGIFMSLFGPISAKHHYGLRLALRLAQSYYQGRPISLREISSYEQISLKYLEQLVVPLKKDGFVKSLRGRSGGYVMVKNPNRVTLKDIIWLYNDKNYLVDCLAPTNNCPLDEWCMSKQVWAEVQKLIEKTLNNITLGSLIKKYGYK